MDKLKKISKEWYLYFGFFLMFVSAASILCFLLRGETTIEGEWSGVETTETLTCDLANVSYPFLSYDKSNSKKIKINIIFNDGIIKTGSLLYVLYYDNEKQINDSENLNHVSINKNFEQDDLEFDALGAKFSRFSNGLQFSLYFDGDFNNVIAKYFMLSNPSKSITEIEQDYTTQKFECKTNNKEVNEYDKQN